LTSARTRRSGRRGLADGGSPRSTGVGEDVEEKMPFLDATWQHQDPWASAFDEVGVRPLRVIVVHRGAVSSARGRGS
jgi:hypothetical protein